MVKRLKVLETEQRTLVYTDALAKQVRGWWQAGYGLERRTNRIVPAAERQSVSRGEIRGALHALHRRRAVEKMVVVLDSEYVYKGITEWSPKWHHHSWRVKSREVGHRALWEAVFSSSRMRGPCLHSSGPPHICGWGGTIWRMR